MIACCDILSAQIPNYDRPEITMTSQKLAVLFAVLLFALPMFAQSPAAEDQEKEKKKKEMQEQVLRILDQAIGDAQMLTLPQNRAVVYAMSGDLYWKFDEKKARELFRNAAAEILQNNADMENERRESTDMFVDLLDLEDVRNDVLPLVARHDAELALELLLQTRSARLIEAMLKADTPNGIVETGMFSFSPEQMRVRQELALEQRFALLAADENPDKAIKLIKESLSRGVSPNVLALLQKLNKKDEKKAGELAADVIKKIVDTDLTKKNDELQAAISFLRYAANPPKAAAKEKVFAFTESQARDLANKIANTLLQPSNSVSMASTMTTAMPLLAKFVPEKMPQLKQRQTASQRALPAEIQKQQQLQKMWNPGTTPESILAQIPKLANELDRINAYRTLESKIGSIEDEARAKRLIDQIPDDRVRERALEQFEAAKVSRAVAAGRLDDARKMIGNLAKKKTQVQKLTALAAEYFRKGGEKNVETAKSLMKDAKMLVNDYAEDEDELNDLLEIIKGYTLIEPETAFRLFDPIVDQINEYVQASAVLSKFNKRNSRIFKRGELFMKVNGQGWDNSLHTRCIPHMQMLGKADLDRMNLLADRFQRTDYRTIVKLWVAQGYILDEKKLQTPGVSGSSVVIN